MAGRSKHTKRTRRAVHTLGGIATAMVRELEAERAAGVTDDDGAECVRCGREYVHGYDSAFCSEACEGDYWHEQDSDTARVDEQGRECAPVTALKKSLISAATAFDDLTKVALRQALFVSPAGNPGGMLVPIEKYDGTPAVGVMREDAVTIGINTRGLTYRPAYGEWQLRVTVEYNPRLVSREQLLALVDQAGWGVGICEGRPERSSSLGWGRFERAA